MSTRALSSSRLRSIRILSSAALAALAAALPAHAQTWNGLGANDNWTTAGNWLPSGAPANNGTANINMAGTVRLSPIVDLSYSVNSLSFNSGAGQFVLGPVSGSTLTIGGGGMANNSGVQQTFNVPVTISTAQTWSTNANAITRLNGTFTSSTALDKTGEGTLRISGPQSHSPGSSITVSGGNLVLDTNAGGETNPTNTASIAVAAGTNTATFNWHQNLASLSIGAGAQVGMQNQGTVLDVNSLTIAGPGGAIGGNPAAWTGTIDLRRNALVVRNGNVGTIRDQLYAGATFAKGIKSTNAWLGELRNEAFFTTSNPPPTLTWNGPVAPTPLIKPTNLPAPGSKLYVNAPFMGTAVSIGANDVFVGPIVGTRMGDCNLDGVIDGQDCYLIEYGWEFQGNPGVGGWYFGDFDQDGDVDGDDFFYLESNYPVQSFIAGQSQLTPILPGNITGSGVMVFNNFPSGAWCDPPVSSIVEYQTTDGSKFNQILNFPDGFASGFEVLVDGESKGVFQVGDNYIFEGAGVSDFAIRGIDPTVDMADGTAFPLQLSLDQGTASFEMLTPDGWIQSGGGNWSDSANWHPSVPNGIGATALLGLAITADSTVTADVPITVGTINFDNNHRYTVAGSNTVTMQVNSGSAAIHVAQGSHTISAPVALASPTVVTVAPAASTLTIGAGGINVGSQQLTVQGAGLTHVTGPLTTAAGGAINKLGSGTLRISGAQSHGVGATMTVGGGNLVMDSDSGGNLGLAVNTGTATFNSSQHFSSLSVGAGAHAGIAANGNRVVATDSLSIAGTTGAWTGQLDIVNNSLLLRNFDKATALNLVEVGALTGQGITTSIPLDAGGIFRGVGAIKNEAFFTTANPAPYIAPQDYQFTPPTPLVMPTNLPGPGSPLWANLPVAGTAEAMTASDMIVRHTFAGDCNLDGIVDGRDYYLIMYSLIYGVPANGPGNWYFGDTNFTGQIDVGDAEQWDWNWYLLPSVYAAGQTQANPILPSSNVNGVMTFTDVPTGLFYDPPVSSIVDYATTDGSKFKQILGFPTGFSGDFEVLLADGTSLGVFGPGDTPIFPGDGVSGFSIRGITPGADMGTNTAFPLAIAFNEGTVSFVMSTPPGWVANANGNWSTSANWSDGVPNGIGTTANFLRAITGAKTITLDSARTVGTVNFDNNNSYSIAGSNALTLQVNTGSAAINVLRGNHAINAPIVLSSNTSIAVTAAASTLTLGGDMSGGGTLTKTGSGTLVAKHVRAAGIDIEGGTVRVTESGGGLAAGTSKVSAISIDSGAKLDLRDNKLVVVGGDVGTWDGNNYTGITGLVESGRGTGSWNGSGIVTSMPDATASVLTTLVVMSADDAGYAGGTFGGQPVSSGDVLVMYSWGGDADMNGELNGDDYFWLDSHVLQNGSVFGFHNGDFDYNGELNGDDYFILDSNILQAQASGIVWATGAGAGGLTPIPEPCLPVVAFASIGMILGRRRRCRVNAH